jgi:hypothetical protein
MSPVENTDPPLCALCLYASLLRGHQRSRDLRTLVQRGSALEQLALQLPCASVTRSRRTLNFDRSLRAVERPRGRHPG